MAGRTALSTATDSFSLLDVVYANQFEGEIIDTKDAEQTEENFYRGAPPTWLNFHISEQAKSYGTGTSLIKRDGYDTLAKHIDKRRKGSGTWTIKLFHQQGCGGTTLAMQVLWDMRKTFRCAVLTGSSSDITKVAKEVVHLFTADGQGHQKTVLLLLNDDQILENLQDSIMMEIAEQKIVTYMPVVIFFNCIRKNAVPQNDHVVLKTALSDTEKQDFDEKKEELLRRFGSKCEQFHGFNILQTNFSQDYIKQACKVICPVPKKKRPKAMQLVGFLSLLNAYVPGSYLLENQCLDLFKHKDYKSGDLTLEGRMKPFSHLIITFQQDAKSEIKVRMAHPMIAQCCTDLMAEAGVTRSDTTRNFLNHLCRDQVPPFFPCFVKDMLTKREKKIKENSTETEKQDKFSRLILDIQEMHGEPESASVLKLASRIFHQNPFFPQALARFYYIERKDYNQAELWANKAKQRDPQNSFIADTLGQVHKNHLMNKKSDVKPREILQLATKAIKAFEHEERLAENEQGTDMKEDGMTKVSRIFNIRGQFGYLQVCKLAYEKLVSQNKNWKGVLTKTLPINSVLELPRDNKLFRFNPLINSLRDEVEKKCDFFDKYLTYSKPDMMKDDATYISRDASDCYRKYVGDSPPKHIKEKGAKFIQTLKQNQAGTSAGVLSCLDRKHTESELKEITTWWQEIFERKDSVTALVNYILAHIMLINTGTTFSHSSLKFLGEFRQKMPLSPNDGPELHMLALLLYWPTDSKGKCDFALSELIHRMHCSYENTYKTYFRSRHLRPLFFIGKGEDLDRIVHRKVLEGLFEKNKEAMQNWTDNWSNENIFKDPMVQDRLLKVDGVVRNYRLYATVNGTKVVVEVDANRRNRLWKHRQVSFYLGFTIRGPVAFDIQSAKTAEKAKISETDTAKSWQIKPELSPCTDTPRGPSGRLTPGSYSLEMDSSDWTKVEPKVNKVDEVHIYSLQSEAGHFECSVSSLRWVCKKKVSFKYHFSSWDEHREKPSCVGYMPAGPLMNITVMTGEMEEVHLPHWIDLDSTMSDMFVVLHVDTSGDFVEQASQVTSSHVKLRQPTFSPRGVMIRVKQYFKGKAHYEALIYKTTKAPLTLHVYLVQPDPFVQEIVKSEEESHKSIIIRKPSRVKPLRMQDNIFLTADKDTAEITGEELDLKWYKGTPQYNEVFLRNEDGDFKLTLEREGKKNSIRDIVWKCPIRKGDYKSQHSDHEQASGQHFVDRHRTDLIERVKGTGHILDKLLNRELISPEQRDKIRGLSTTYDKMRDIIDLMTTKTGKDALYEILHRMRSMRPLISELEKSGLRSES